MRKNDVKRALVFSCRRVSAFGRKACSRPRCALSRGSREGVREAASDSRPLGHACPALGREVHPDAPPRQHVDERIDAEAMQSTSHEIVHAGLTHA